MAKRGRVAENNVSLSYLIGLNSYYQNWANNELFQPNIIPTPSHSVPFNGAHKSDYIADEIIKLVTIE